MAAQDPLDKKQYPKNKILMQRNKRGMYTLKPPAVPMLMTKSGLIACIDAYVNKAAGTVPTLSTPAWMQPRL